MKILIIGGTGHVGTHLVPLLQTQGHEVYVATRGNKNPPASWGGGIKLISCDANDPQSLQAVADSVAFDTVIDFPGTGFAVWNAFSDKVSHVIVCGSHWMFGRPEIIPAVEKAQAVCPFPNYARRFEQIQLMLSESGQRRAVFTAIMPSNICGPGKIPLDTLGGRSIDVHRAAMRGETVYLPDGPQAFIAPCDAADLAQLFALAVNNREKAAGQMFNGGPAYALSSTRFVEVYGELYGVAIPIEYISWESYKEYNPNQSAWWHFYADMCPDISKARELLGYKPQYTPEQAMCRAVEWMKEQYNGKDEL